MVTYGCANGQFGFLHFLAGTEEGADVDLSGECDFAFGGVVGDGFGAVFGEWNACLEMVPAVTLVVEGTVPVEGFGLAGGLDGAEGTVSLGFGFGRDDGCIGAGCHGSVLELEGVNSDGR